MHRNSFFNKLEEGILAVLFQQVTDHLYGRGRRPVFVEVGANDGVNSSKTIEFVRYHEWSGLEIEPVPSVYASLEANLAPYHRVIAVNKAISDRRGVLPFYQVIAKGSREGDNWLPMLSSFDRDVILKQKVSWPDIEDHIEEIEVETATLTDVCNDHGIDRLDLLITDAEGHDDRIVHTLDLSRYRPLMINIEHVHIPPDRLRQLDAVLMVQGYQRCIMWMDTAWFVGDILEDECVQRMIRSMPGFMPDYDTLYGNGYWLSHFRS